MALWSLSLAPVGFLLCAAGCRLLLRLGGPMDQPGEEAHKQHERAVPSTGGHAVFAAVAGPLAAILLGAALLPASFWSGPLPPIAPHVAGLRNEAGQGTALLLALAVFHALGVADDRRGLAPRTKLAVEAAVALALAGLFDVRVLHLLDALGPAGTAASVGLGALWLVGITNAFNFLDNMDGIAGGVAAVIAALYLGATLAVPGVAGQWFDAAFAALLLGAAVGFLGANFPPARLFLGDGGSLVIGLGLAVLSVETTYVRGDVAAAWHGLFMPFVLMAIPLYDLATVTLIRLRRGASPFVGDRNHFSHRLRRRGLSPRATAVCVWLCTAATGLGGVILPTLAPWQAGVIAAQTATILALMGVLEAQAP